jgi:hypothetical protein
MFDSILTLNNPRPDHRLLNTTSWTSLIYNKLLCLISLVIRLSRLLSQSSAKYLGIAIDQSVSGERTANTII